MKLINKNILLISPGKWEGNFVSKHHYAHSLAKLGNTVYFLNPPSASFQVKQGDVPNLYIVDDVAHLPAIGRLPRFISSRFIKSDFRRLEHKLGCSFDIIWNFDSSRYFNLSRLPKRVLKIQHIVDLNEDFQRGLGAATSDICFGTTDFIVAEQKRYNSKAFKIHHGTQELESEEDISLPINPSEKTMVGYIGNLTIRYLDWELIYKLVQQHPAVGFMFIGPLNWDAIQDKIKIKRILQAVMDCTNTYFPGAVPSTQVPALLKLFDVLLVAYKANDYREQLASPHKFMEYFASGRPIVTTYTDEYKDKRDLVVMSDRNEEFPTLFSNVLSNLNTFSQPAEQQKRMHFARSNSYSMQITRINHLIEKHCSCP